jgi:hypothetical protein
MTTLQVFPDLEQNTPEWHAMRCGVLTASFVGKLLTIGSPGALDYDCPECGATADNPCVSRTRKEPTPIKVPHAGRSAVAAAQASTAAPVIQVAHNETAEAATGTLIAERITGWTEDTPMTSDMWRGMDCEPIARDLYAQHYRTPVTEVGFMRLDGDGWQLGYSPDGVVGDNGLIEIKAPRAKNHLRTILSRSVPVYHMAQLQTGLLVSGRAWIDFVSFVGGMPLYVKRVTPDPAWFAAITAAAVSFEANAARIIADYQARTADMPPTERVDFDLKVA